MVNYCCVPLCNGIGGFHFPRDKLLKDKWRVSVKKGVHGKKGKLWDPSKHDVVCHRHFQPEDFTTREKNKRMRLKKGVVPSVFLERMSTSSLEKLELKERRRERIEQRRTKNIAKCSYQNPDSLKIHDVQMEVEVSSETVSEAVLSPVTVNVAIQCELPVNFEAPFSVEKFIKNPIAMKYYTGFDDYEHFMMFHTCLGPAVDHLNKKYKLKPCDQLFVTLMKLRQNKDDYEIGLLFNLSKTRVSSIVNTWINFMFFQLNEMHCRSTGIKHVKTDVHVDKR